MPNMALTGTPITAGFLMTLAAGHRGLVVPSPSSRERHPVGVDCDLGSGLRHLTGDKLRFIFVLLLSFSGYLHAGHGARI